MSARARLRRASAPAATFVVGIAAWELAVRALHVAEYLLPPPSRIALAAARESDALARAALVTGSAALAGFASSAILGVALGFVLASSRTVERAFYPYAVFLQTVPIVAIAPLLVLWFDPGFRAVAVSAFVVSLFPVIASTLGGMKSVDAGLVDAFRLYGASRFATLAKLRLEWAVPQIVTGLRIASGLSVIGAIVGEFVAGFSEGSAGLGITILAAYRQLRTDLLFAAVGGSSLLGLALFALVGLAGEAWLRRRHQAR